ncbi:MAG: aldo/keto reductase [Planctomycetota bacterium]
MKKKQDNIDRRNFLKTVGTVGLSSIFALDRAIADSNCPNSVGPNTQWKVQKSKLSQMPKRKLGKTGVEVPCLAFGGGFNLVDKQIVLRQAVQWGVDFFDTSPAYAGRNSELGLGKFLLKNPEIREKLFISTKAAGAKTVADIENQLQKSLESINTKYIDLYYGGYMLSDPAQLTNELKLWVQNAKKRRLIRFFGFTTHKNMDKCLTAAAKLGWIDAIMTSYNFHLMQDPKMQAAVEVCHKAGVGLIAMKTQGLKITNEADDKLVKHFQKKGFTEGQAKIKVVLEDKRISSACVKMQNVTLLTSNVSAVLDKTKFSQADMNVFKDYARVNCNDYCAGCANICDSALPETPFISDIMRYLMYYNSYGEQNIARELFAQIPTNVRGKLLRIDYSSVEAYCPQRLPIGKLVTDAVSKLA